MAPSSRKSGYKRIRFKTWDPESVGTARKPGGIIQWQPNTKDEDIAHSTTARVPRTKRNTELARRHVPEKQRKSLICPSPLQRLPQNGTRMDPFTELPIKAVGCVPSTLDYFVIVCSHIKRIKLENGPGSGLDPHLALLLPFALQHAVVLESIITACRASILVSQGKSALEDKAFMYHRGQTIHSLTMKLQSNECTDDATLLSVANMMTTEYLIGNVSGVSAHLAGMKRLMEIRENEPSDNDSSDTLSHHFFRKGFEASASLGAFVTGQTPPATDSCDKFVENLLDEVSNDEHAIYPTAPLSSSIRAAVAHLPLGFKELCLSGNLAIKSINILASLIKVVSSETPTLADQQRLTANLETMLSAIRRLSSMSVTPLEKILACGLIAYIFQLRCLSFTGLFQDPQLRSFIDLIPTHYKVESVREQNALIWISISATGALSLRAVNMTGSHTLLDRIFELYPYTTTNWARLEEVLRTFLWNEKIGAHWRICWEKAMKRREDLALQGQRASNDPQAHVLEITSLDDEYEDDFDISDTTTWADTQYGSKVAEEEVQTWTQSDEVTGVVPHPINGTMDGAQCPFQAQMRRRFIPV